jgi:UDP-N-acetylglucosamine 2-epimerase (non-hydrolysing)
MRTRPLVAVVYGTRPEAIKVAPVIRALQADPDLDTQVILTGQHRDLVAGVNEFFGIAPDLDLAIGRHGQSLTDIMSGALTGLAGAFSRLRPDAVLVHGDTTTSTAAALCAYYHQIPVVHLEAGLRSGDLLSPYPEEGNRQLTGRLAALHLAPTPRAKASLLAENVAPENIAVTGNTVIDALLYTVAQPVPIGDERLAEAARRGERIVVVTGHRRESWAGGLGATARAIARVLASRPDVVVALPMHPNPIVRAAIEPELGGLDRAVLIEPLDYPEFCHLMAAAWCIVTDSGGIQEEAPSLGKPVLVTRTTTERPEAIAAGSARLVGTGEAAIVDELSALLDDQQHYDRMSTAVNPYGDGRAAPRATAALKAHLGLGDRLEDFAPAAQPRRGAARSG